MYIRSILIFWQLYFHIFDYWVANELYWKFVSQEETQASFSLVKAAL